MVVSKYIDLKEDFIREYKGGLSLRQISKKYEVGVDTIKRLIKEEVEFRVNKLSEETLSKIYDLYEQEQSISEIADSLKIGYNSVKRYISKKYGLEQSFKLEEEKVASMKQDYMDGCSMKRLAKKYGVSASSVQNYLSVKDFEIRTLSEAIRKIDIDFSVFEKPNRKNILFYILMLDGGFIGKGELRFGYSSCVSKQRVINIAKIFIVNEDNIVVQESSENFKRFGCSKQVYTRYRFEVHSKDLIQQLIEFKEKVFEDKYYYNLYWKMYILRNYSDKSYGISIKSSKQNREGLKKYLKSIGIEVTTKLTVVIYAKDNISKLRRVCLSEDDEDVIYYRENSKKF